MAVVKQRLNMKTATGYNTVHLETSSDLVLRADGTTIEAKFTSLDSAIAGKADSGHTHTAQTTVSGNAGSATKLATARTIDGVSFNGTAAIAHYGECSTAAGTAAKTVACTGFTLVTGATIKVKFTVTNTAANPTLNVNSTGAKAIHYRGAAITAGYLAQNRVYEFVYDGTQYNLIGDIDTNTNTTYTAASAAPKDLATAAAVGTSAKYAREDHVHKFPTAAQVGAAASSHTHSNYAASDHTHSGYASSSHSHAAGTITAGTLIKTVLATNDTDYTTSRLRNIRASTSDLTAGSSALNNGEIYLVYE